jgi:hypothetical protein
VSAEPQPGYRGIFAIRFRRDTTEEQRAALMDSLVELLVGDPRVFGLEEMKIDLGGYVEPPDKADAVDELPESV